MRQIRRALPALVLAGGLAACQQGPDGEDGAVAEVTTTVTSTHSPPAPEPSPAQQRVPQDLRAQVASLMVVGVSNYDQARFALDQGVGGLIIPSWADPALLTEPGRDINALREQYPRPFSVAVDFEGGRVQRHTQVFGQWMPPGQLAGQPDAVIRGTGYDIGRSLRALDMAPYATALPQYPTASVMMGHMIVPGLGAGDVPSSLNPEAYRILRQGDYPGGQPFDGVAVTDDLSGMRGIIDYRPTPQAVRDAIAAGADQALWTTGADIPAIIGLVTQSVIDGSIPRERIDAAAVRTQQQLIDVGL